MTTPRKSGLPVFSSSGFGSSGDTSFDMTTNNTAMSKLNARKSLLGLRQQASSSIDTEFTSSSSTPKRTSFQKSIVNDTPSAAAAATKMKRKLEIGDEVVAEVNGKRFYGVLRHLGPVSFRAGEFAGLELIGESTGKGKNDGSVDGRQYFACEPGNGMFCPSAKVKAISNAPATEATARPQSAMSTHSGRSSVTDENHRPPSVTPGRPRSSLAHSSIAKASFTPGRPNSRSSIGRPGSSLAQTTPTAKAPLPRLMPRKSVMEGLADEEGRRRAKTSAEEAEKAEGRITEGSRAHRFLNMSAKDLEARRLKGLTNETGNTSPLKETLLSGHRNLPPTTPKIRTSIGTSGTALPLPSAAATAVTPKASKGRFSLFGQTPKTTLKNGKMAPPSTAGPGSPISKISDNLAPPKNPPSTNLIPRTPSRLSNASGGTSSAVEEETEKNGAKERNRSLLEAMALLTPAHKSSEISPSLEDVPRMSIEPNAEMDGENVFSGAGLALIPGDGVESYESSNDTAVGQAVVPLSLYEESNLEITRLKTQLTQLRQSVQESEEKGKSAQEVELERAKIKAREEERKELEEERRVEREDEQRRRKTELEVKEREWKEKADGVQKELRKLQDEHTRMKNQHEKTKDEFESRLKENETLVEKLKTTAETSGTADNESLGQIQAKDLELAQLNDRLQRLETTREQEKADYLKEIDELKDAGQEALDLYDRERAMSDEQIIDLEGKLHLLEAKAQEAIADAMRERDEALQANIKVTQKDPSSAAEIDQRSLEDQLSQAQSRTMKLEDQLSEANTIMQQEREEHIRRKDKYAEFELKYKEERTKVKQHIKQLENADAESRFRVDELLEALEESRSALESERSELETLRAEAMMMGEGPDGVHVKSLDISRLEAEVERLNGLLEGARSGKREATRQLEEQRREMTELHSLLDEARMQMDQDKVRSKGTTNNDEVQRLRQILQEQDRELEIVRKSSIPVPEQVETLLQSTNKEIAMKEEEIQRLRKKVEDLSNKLSSSSSSLGIPSNNRFSVDSQGLATSPIPENNESTSPSINGMPTSTYSPGLPASKRFSTASTQSRRSYGSGMGSSGMTNSEAMAKELSGLRSIVNTLNQELTEVKVTSKQQERELYGQIEQLKNEARRWQLMTEQSGSSSSSVGVEERLGMESKLQKAEEEIVKLREKVKNVEQSRHQEVEKLNKDIGELEALCEATVWRREEQEARRQELERKVAKLQRHLDRLQSSNGDGKPSQENGVKNVKEIKTHSPSNSNGAMTASSESHNLTNSTNKIVVQPETKHLMNTIEQTCAECNETGHIMDDCPYLNDDVLF